MRLNKYISERGVGSRRQADQWIEAGRVTINGLPATLGTQVSDVDDVRIDGKPLGVRRTAVYVLLNKPVTQEKAAAGFGAILEMLGKL